MMLKNPCWQTYRQAVINLFILAVLTWGILPLVPNTFIGPYHAINPKSLLLIVILVMFVGELSQIAIRWLGPRHGLPIFGLFSGFISSIATITTMANQSKDAPHLIHGAIAGAIWSSLATILELAILLFVLDISILKALCLPIVLGSIAIFVFGLFASKKALRQQSTEIPQIKQSARFISALWLALVIASVLVVTAAVKSLLGQASLVTVSALAGFADVHAPTIAMTSLVATSKLSVPQAMIAILLAFSMNAVTKAIVALTTASKAFSQPVIIALLVQVLAVWLGWYLY